MKEQKQWQKPNLGVLKSSRSTKAAASSRRSEMHYSIGPSIGPTPSPAFFKSLGPSIGPAKGPTPAPERSLGPSIGPSPAPASFKSLGLASLRDGRAQYDLGPSPEN